MREQNTKIIEVAPGISSQTTSASNRHSRKVSQSPCWTNDVDTDQRRRTLNSAVAMPLTDPFIEGSQKRVLPRSLVIAYPCAPSKSIITLARGWEDHCRPDNRAHSRRYACCGGRPR
jgi:hypothetical protein